MTSIEQLIGTLGARIDAFAAGDPQPILHPRAAGDARELGVLVLQSPGGPSARVAVVLAMLHWYRCLASPEPDDRDMEGSLMWWSAVAETDPHVVPESLREAVTDFRATIDAPKQTAWAIDVLSQESAPQDKATLHRAVDALTTALDSISGDDPEFVVQLLWCLGKALSLRFDMAGAVDDLHLAIDVMRRLVSVTPPDARDMMEHLTNLGCLLMQRTEHAPSPEDLDEAILLLTRALAMPGPDRRLALSNLAAALCSRFKLKGEIADLDRAIEHLLSAAAVIADQPSARAKILTNLGGALAARYDLAGEMEDLTESVSCAREAVSLTPDADPDHAIYLSNLCSGLQRLFVRSRSTAHFDEAVEVGRKALDLTPRNHPSRRVHLTNFALLLIRPLGAADPAHLDEAFRMLEEAGLLTPADHPERAEQLATAGAAGMSRFDRTGKMKDLDEAIRAMMAAAEQTPLGHPARARHLAVAGALLLRRPRRWGTAIRCSSEAYRSVAAPPSVRLFGARIWALAVALRDGLRAAFDPYTAAVELLGVLAWRGVSQRSRRDLLSDGPTHLPLDAAASAIAAGRPGSAVQLLESGRALIWSEVLDTRSDLTALREVSRPLADRLTVCRSRLENLEWPGPGSSGQRER